MDREGRAGFDSAMSVELELLVRETDLRLRVAEIPDYPPAKNGLQLANRAGRVTRVASAVDASRAAIDAALECRADLLVVHHGLFWSGIEPLTGPAFGKVAAAIDGGLAVYSCHLPLDVHPELGNNALLARALGFEPERMGRFLDWKGLALGLAADGGDEGREDFVARLGAAVGGPVHLCPGGPDRVGRVGICTGGAGGEVAAARASGIDTFVTGEGPHWSFPLALELGINVLYAGHWATETFGVKALAAELIGRYGLEDAGFLELPSGL